MKKILILCAHPDDETLGLGGTIVMNSRRNHEIMVVFFTDGQSARDSSIKKIKKRQQNAKDACKILGIDKIEFLNYKDQLLDTIPVVELTKKIEHIIRKWSPEQIYTHYWGDTNQDHRKVFEASLIASRPHPKSEIKQIICYETPSSSEWTYFAQGFTPNMFVKINETLEAKINALKKYESEVEEFPHPRSVESIINRSKFWGSSVGLNHAEAFISIRKIID